METPPGAWAAPADSGPADPGAAAGPDADTFASPDLTARELALLDYADRVTLAPASVSEEHIAALRAAGFDDRAIHDACAIIAYFAFVNRIADGLGVELEADEREWKGG